MADEPVKRPREQMDRIAREGDAEELGALGIMVTERLACPEGAVVCDVAGDLHRRAEEYAGYDVQYACVVASGRWLAGVLRLRDLLLVPARRPVQEIMIRDPVSVRDDTDLDGLAELLDHHGFRGVPVVAGRGVLLGVARQRDLDEALAAARGPGWLRSQGIVGGDEGGARRPGRGRARAHACIVPPPRLRIWRREDGEAVATVRASGAPRTARRFQPGDAAADVHAGRHRRASGTAVVGKPRQPAVHRLAGTLRRLLLGPGRREFLRFALDGVRRGALDEVTVTIAALPGAPETIHQVALSGRLAGREVRRHEERSIPGPRPPCMGAAGSLRGARHGAAAAIRDLWRDLSEIAACGVTVRAVEPPGPRPRLSPAPGGPAEAVPRSPPGSRAALPRRRSSSGSALRSPATPRSSG